MCSQRLPRPGRLCRECEQELELARSARPQGGFAQGPRPDELLLIGASPWLRMPSRPVVVVAAFAVGLSAAGRRLCDPRVVGHRRCRIGDDRSPCGSRQVAAEAGAASRS
jgi:hypothetical protein